ncbi:13805_t:CDS:2 [Entrophospora sp. SA101]|nr:13805_t:CDS:2 [Entrophospora sp. SA101]
MLMRIDNFSNDVHSDVNEDNFSNDVHSDVNEDNVVNDVHMDVNEDNVNDVHMDVNEDNVVNDVCDDVNEDNEAVESEDENYFGLGGAGEESDDNDDNDSVGSLAEMIVDEPGGTNHDDVARTMFNGPSTSHHRRHKRKRSDDNDELWFGEEQPVNPINQDNEIPEEVLYKNPFLGYDPWSSSYN